MAKLYMIQTTMGSKKEASELAHHVISSKLGACVHIGPTTSVYSWEGGVEETEEWLVQIKTVPSLCEVVMGAIQELHSYDVPEILCVPIEMVSNSYFDWVCSQCLDSPK